MKDIYRKYNYQHFPSVKWKKLNLERVRKDNPDEWQDQINKLEAIFRL